MSKLWASPGPPLAFEIASNPIRNQPTLASHWRSGAKQPGIGINLRIKSPSDTDAVTCGFR
jgi:hypothetical protein